MGQGKKSNATKKRQKLIQQGKLPPPTVDPKKKVAGLLGAVATNGYDFVSLIPKIQSNKSAPDIARDIIRDGSILAAQRLVSLAGGLGEYATWPKGLQYSAMRDVVEKAGISIKDTGGGKPLSEMSLSELHDFIQRSEAELSQRIESETKNVSGTPRQSDELSDSQQPQPSDSNTKDNKPT